VNVEEDIAEMVAEEVAKEVVEEVVETAEENDNVNAEESGENVIVEVHVKKKDHLGLLRRSFRIKTVVLKKRG